MGRMEFLKMKTDDEVSANLIESDVNELKVAAKKLIKDAAKLGGLGFGTSFLKWVASFAAIYLLILDRTNWRSNMLTSLLVPYIFFSLPSVLFNFFRGSWKVDCFCCSGSQALLPTTFSRLAGDARINNSSSGCGSKFLCTHLEGERGRCLHMPYHCLLPIARAHPGIWWIQKFVYTAPWNIKHCWDYPSDSLSCVGTSASLLVGTLACRLEQ
uniref:Cold temperature stress protein n=1 Tax=Populus x xiaohei TaxID=591066 RepID=A0A7D4XTE4_9ROSI|nr:cold temperature stress protein [Populus simonii x Populus nigra]